MLNRKMLLHRSRNDYWLGGLLLVVLFTAILAGLIHPFYHRRIHILVSLFWLPLDVAESLLRMIAAYLLSLIFALVVGTYATRHPRAERIILPILDILQSIPIVTFFPAALAVAVDVLGGGRLGFEFAAVVLIFTSMAWNLAFSVYESIVLLPPEVRECAESFGIRGMQRFVAIILPACIPSLLYNSILSWTAGWFALTACEILTISTQNVTLPGIGSFLANAADSHHPIAYNLIGVAVLLAVVAGIELFVWRPLAVWAQRFRYEMSVSTLSRDPGGIAGWYQRGRLPRLLMQAAIAPLNRGVNALLAHLKRPAPRTTVPRVEKPGASVRMLDMLQRVVGWTLVTGIIGGGVYYLLDIFSHPFSPLVKEIPVAIAWSFLRITAAYLLSLLWTIPLVIWAFRRPRVLRALSSFSQILASMPTIALTFVAVGVFVLHSPFGPHWGVELAGLVLLMNGMQWYVLFNMLGGVSRIPGDLIEACDAMGLSPLMRWRKLVFPAILPALFTGTITAFGGGWNTLIFSESIFYANHYYHVLGIGWLLDVASTGQNPPISSGATLPPHYASGLLLCAVGLLIVTIVLVNRLLWKSLKAWALDRFRIEY